MRLISVAATVLLLLVAVLPASASNIVYWSFVASLDSGSMADTTFPVCYSYDADQVAPVGASYVTLNSFDFTLGTAQFTRSDIFQGGQVIFKDGVAQDVTASFQVFLPPNSPVSNITFGFGGDGVIGYIDLDGNSGDGSFSLADQVSGCDPAAISAARSRTPSAAVRTQRTTQPRTTRPSPVAPACAPGARLLPDPGHGPALACAHRK